jgi:hypothetical protein
MIDIHNLNLTDTEFAALAAKGYDSSLEHMMIEAGESPSKTRSPYSTHTN